MQNWISKTFLNKNHPNVEEEVEHGEGAGVATDEEAGPAGEVGDGENPPQQTCSACPPRPRQQPDRKTESKSTTTLYVELQETACL